MTTTTRPASELDDVLYEFALATERPDAALLDEFTRRYPEHAAALTSFAVSVALDTLTEAKEPPAGLPKEGFAAISRAMSRFQNRLHAAKTDTQAKRATLSPQNPFAVLSREEARSLAERLHANSVFIMKLRDREVDEDTMTDGFKRHVAEELKAPLQLIVAHFAAPPEIRGGRGGMHFKADTKPQVGAKQAFRDAVQNCGLTPEQQDYLLSL